MKIYNYNITFTTFRRSINRLNSKIDRLLCADREITGLLPASMKKSKHTGMTTSQFIEIILRNL